MFSGVVPAEHGELELLQGVAYAADFAAIGVLCSRWASMKQNALFLSVLTCYSALATSVTNPVAGLVSRPNCCSTGSCARARCSAGPPSSTCTR